MIRKKAEEARPAWLSSRFGATKSASVNATGLWFVYLAKGVPSHCAGFSAYFHFQETEVPEVSRFFGIIIAMYYNDHSPPHFHAKHGGDQASLRIDNGEILEGTLGARELRLVEEWRSLHLAELLEDWTRAQARQSLNKIEPLE